MLRGESRWPQLGLLLLFYELFAAIGLTKIPPVTLAIIGLQVCLFLKNVSHFLGVWTLWPTSMLCLNARIMLEQNQQQFYRAFTAPLFHVTDLHLYYNMISFAWKGIRLERRFGKVGFLLLLVVLSGLTGVVYVGLCAAVSKHLSDDSYMSQCAVGFSAVLFALKVLADDSDGDFGLFAVPRKMAIWAELLIIQILVPNASFLGHLSGIVAGILLGHMIPMMYDLTVKTPLRLIQRSPMTFFIISGLVAFHMEWIQRPWTKRLFWSSGTPLVCLSANHVLKAKSEWYRLFSGPLEHAGGAHFAMCIVSLAIKLYQLEQKHSTLRTLAIFLMSFLSTGICYVVTQTILTKLAQVDASECVEGLSGVAFALKVLVIFSGENLAFMLFEITEGLMLLETRTLPYHISGIIAGLAIWMVYLKPKRFPGQGVRLGAGNRPTRSWGYAHYTEDQFRRVVNTSHDSSGGSDRSSNLSHSMSRRSETPSPSMTPVLGPRPRCPPPPNGSCPPPPRTSSGVVLSDRESQSPLTEDDSIDYEL